MTPNTFPMAVYVVGLVIGTVVILSVVRVANRTSAFTIPGTFTCFLGVLLVGISIWSSVKVSVSEEGVTAEFRKELERVETSVMRVAEAGSQVSTQVADIAERVEAGRSAFIELASELERQGQPRRAELNRIRQRVEGQVELHPERIRSIGAVAHPDSLPIARRQ